MTALLRILPSLAPGLTAFLNPWVILVVVALVGGVWWHGYHKATKDIRGEQAIARVVVITKQGAVTERVVTEYLERVRDAEPVIIRIREEVEVYADANPGLCLDTGWRRLHDNAAERSLPEPRRRPDGEVRAAEEAAPGRRGTGGI